MKKLLIVLLLASCASPTEKVTQEAISQLNSLKESLPCEIDESKFSELNLKINSISDTCKLELKSVNSTNTALWVVILILAILIFLK